MNKLNNYIKLLFCASLLIPIQLSAQDSNYAFSLKEAIAYALENNQQIKSADLEKKIADQLVLEILADGLPQVNANADLGHNFKKPTVPFDFESGIKGVLVNEGLIAPFVPGEAAGTSFVTDYSGSAGISLNQMIFDGSFFVGLEAARTFTQLSYKNHIKTKIDIADAVSKAYYGVLINQEIKTLVEKNYNRIETLLKDTKALYQSGFAEKIDVSRVQVQFNNLNVEKTHIDKNVELSKALLKFQMGIAVGGEIELTDNISNLEYENIQPDVMKNFTYSNRIEISQMITQKDLNDLDIKNMRVKRIPKINLYASYGAASNSETFSDLTTFSSPNWFGVGVIGIKLNTPIFDGFRKKRQIQQKRIKAEQINLSFSQLKNSIDLELKQSAINYNKNKDNLRAQKENLSLAQEIYGVTKIKYNEGVGSNSEVLDADAALKQSQTNYYNALYEALIAKIDMQKALGTLLN